MCAHDCSMQYICNGTPECVVLLEPLVLFHNLD